MSKAILVIDMPEKCKNCDLYNEDKYADYICMATFQVIDGNEKSKDCPLKPMPNKIEEIPTSDTLIKDSKYNARGINLEKAILKAKQNGYNACIDEILGETDNE